MPPHPILPFPHRKKGPSPSPIFAPKAHLSRSHCSPAVGVERRDIIHPSAAAAAAAEEEEEEEEGEEEGAGAVGAVGGLAPCDMRPRDNHLEEALDTLDRSDLPNRRH